MTILFLVLIAFNHFSACKSERNIKCGLAYHQIRYFDSSKNIFVKESSVPDRKLLYYGEYVIMETRNSHTIVDYNKKVTIDTSVERYIFLNFKKRIVLEYASFDSDAKPLRKYCLVDSVTISNSWNFYANSNIFFRDSIYSLNDTLVDGIYYHRVVGQKKGQKMIGYYEKDRKSSLFHFDKKLDDSLKINIIRLDLFRASGVGLGSATINFKRSFLTMPEKKVFISWIKKSNS